MVIFEDGPAPESYEYRAAPVRSLGLFHGGLSMQLTRSGTEGFSYVAQLYFDVYGRSYVILRRPQQGTQLPWEYVPWRYSFPLLGPGIQFCEQTFRLVAPGLCARQKEGQGSFEYSLEIPSSPSTFRYAFTIYGHDVGRFPLTSYNHPYEARGPYFEYEKSDALGWVFERAVTTAPQPMCSYKSFSGEPPGHWRDLPDFWASLLLEAEKEGFLPVAAISLVWKKHRFANLLGERCVEPNSQ